MRKRARFLSKATNKSLSSLLSPTFRYCCIYLHLIQRQETWTQIFLLLNFIHSSFNVLLNPETFGCGIFDNIFQLSSPNILNARPSARWRRHRWRFLFSDTSRGSQASSRTRFSCFPVRPTLNWGPPPISMWPRYVSDILQTSCG